MGDLVCRLEIDIFWSTQYLIEIVTAALLLQASLFDMATTAQKSKGRGKGSKKVKTNKASKSGKKAAKPFPDKAGDSFLPAQGACAGA